MHLSLPHCIILKLGPVDISLLSVGGPEGFWKKKGIPVLVLLCSSLLTLVVDRGQWRRHLVQLTPRKSQWPHLGPYSGFRHHCSRPLPSKFLRHLRDSLTCK